MLRYRFPEKYSIFSKKFCILTKHSYLCSPNSKREAKLRYGVMVALQILALSVRVRVLLSQQSSKNINGGIAQLVRAHDS